MGRKNRRMNEAVDKNFIKFMDNINKRNCNKNTTFKHNNEKRGGFEYRNRERLRYSLEQFQRERIQYDILDEEKGIVRVYHQSTGDEYTYYAFTGTLKGVDNLKGLQNVLEFLYT